VLRREHKRILRYALLRGISLFAVVVVAVYITILIANMGGYVDQIIKSEVRFEIGVRINQDPAYKNLPPSKKAELIEGIYQQEIKRLGLDTPFIFRSHQYLLKALTLDLGRSLYLTSDTGSRLVRNIILERLPATILLFTSINVILFFISITFGLYASRKYGSKLDKFIVALSPLSSIPGWFYGIFLILIFAATFRLLPYGGLVDIPPPEDPFQYALSVLRHMALPVLSWLVAYTFIQTYMRRTFFLMFSQEDYVEMAEAKGLPPRMIERRYILKPTLPPIITDFSLTLISSWMGAIITERVFNWPGIGTLLYRAAVMLDSPVIIGSVVIYAYLLVVTVFVLDLVYAIVDPRVRLGVT